MAFINNLLTVLVNDILNQRCKVVPFDTIADKILLCDGKHFYVVQTVTVSGSRLWTRR